MSDERGIAFIPDLEQNHLTDIVVDQSTFADSYDMSLFEGVSIRPHPGSVTKLDFPVVVSGEMDGQSSVASDSGTQPARNLQVVLTAPDGRIEKSATTATDGYWAISSIRPGVYYLTANTAKMDEPAYTLPEKSSSPLLA